MSKVNRKVLGIGFAFIFLAVLAAPMVGARAVNGHGTGEFEGVKITGLTTTTPGTGVLHVDRAGIVMGWPT